MIKFTIHSICTASPCKKQTKVCPIFLIEQISCSIPDIILGITSGEGSLFLFLILSTNVLAIPKVILLISLLICVVICQTGFYLFPCSPFFGICKLDILSLFFLCKLFWNIFVKVQLRLSFWCQCGQISLNSHM